MSICDPCTGCPDAPSNMADVAEKNTRICLEAEVEILRKKNQRLREALQYAVDSCRSNDPLCCPVCRTWSPGGDQHRSTCWYHKAKEALNGYPLPL